MRLAPLLVLMSVPCAAQGVAGTIGSSRGMASQANNPVSMVFESKHVQTLADGTHITTVTHETFYRDREGRTRTDHELPFPVGTGTPMYAVAVQDPVAGFFLHWQTGGQTTGSRQRQFTSLDTDATRAQALQDRADEAAANPPTPRLQRDPSTAQKQSSGQAVPKHTNKILGLQQVEGVPCEASQSTTVYPIGSVGNDRVITVTSERCISREFGRPLREVSEDPRTGTRTLTLQSVTRGEPDPMLFHPPADYAEKAQTP